MIPWFYDFRRFELFCTFLHKTKAGQNNNSWIGVPGNKNKLVNASCYVDTIPIATAAWGECVCSAWQDEVLNIWYHYGWQFFCQISTGGGSRILLQRPDLRYFGLLPGGFCVTSCAAQFIFFFFLLMNFTFIYVYFYLFIDVFLAKGVYLLPFWVHQTQKKLLGLLSLFCYKGLSWTKCKCFEVTLSWDDN